MTRHYQLSIKVASYLDPVTSIAPEEIPSVALESQPGDAVFFSHRL